MMMSQSPERTGDTATIAVLSWALAAVAVEPARTTDAGATRWLAVHPADANLAARLAGHAATCRF
jgi:hypothetical protein